MVPATHIGRGLCDYYYAGGSAAIPAICLGRRQRAAISGCFFTATSATSVTGLVVVDSGTYFSVAGQVIIMLLIQIGGLGFMTMGTLFALVLKKRICCASGSFCKKP